jgi:N-acetylglucosaminyldiphosphoundecaprenol N-acetyl-beta-D-mannosaminyltransferase
LIDDLAVGEGGGRVSNPHSRLPAYGLLGVTVNAIDFDTLFSLMQQAIGSGERCIIGNHNLHSIYLCHHDSKMRQFYALARYVFVDGMSIIYLGRLLGYPLHPQHRITSVHWIRPLLARGAKEGWRTFILGGKPGTAARAAKVLEEEIPGVQIQTAHGYFDATPGHPQAEEILEQIAHYRPHFLCLGMGMPRQEHWMVDHFDKVQANVICNLGALAEYVAGELPTPPEWLGRRGGEWLFRVVTRPDRVWRRYFIEPWFLLPHLGRDLAARVGRW